MALFLSLSLAALSQVCGHLKEKEYLNMSRHLATSYGQTGLSYEVSGLFGEREHLNVSGDTQGGTSCRNLATELQRFFNL